jgi:hypothetical protein
MAFSMRMAFVDVICDSSLKNLYAGGEKIGFSFDVRLGYYRGHWLSCIDRLEVKVDGEIAALEKTRLGINGKEFSVPQLQSCYSEFWRLLDPARITVFREGGLANGEHRIELTLFLRIPYLPIGPERSYMPLDSSGEKTLKVE